MEARHGAAWRVVMVVLLATAVLKGTRVATGEVLVLAGGEVKDWTHFDSLFGPGFVLADYTEVDHPDDGLALTSECYEYEVRVEVFFGLDVKCGGGLAGVATQIADREFESFLDREVTPRFPQGFSVMDVPLGQWYSPARRAITKERSKMMMLLMPDTRENDRKLRAIAHSYTTTFHQETVMISKSPLFSYCFVGASSKK
jgi:hypothetical protein